MKLGVLSLAALVSVCSLLSDATLTIEADEPIRDARLVLNDENVPVTRTSEHSVMAVWDGPEATGVFRITFRDGTTTTCYVGYLEGKSFYDQKYEVIDRQCEPVLQDQSVAS